ncbi:MAG: DNA repair protein RadA, partial [Rhodospirillaceae bacterium]
MAKLKSLHVCQNCGHSQPKWAGQCPACNEWNSLVEEQAPESAPKGLGAQRGRRIVFVGLKGSEAQPPRRITRLAEFDRVTGGGLVPGSATLVGGDPGIGKSTLLMQVAAALADGMHCVYISGEEAIDQLRLRASRLGLENAPVGLAAATSVRDIAASLDGAGAPDVVVIDSIQCMYVDSIESAPGTVSQVRTSAQELIRLAKRTGFALILVGHVTKEGAIAGPRVLEHMVDTVLYFEGDPSHQFRILRSVKNRFGPADEIGVFEMMETGLHEVPNPSALF